MVEIGPRHSLDARLPSRHPLKVKTPVQVHLLENDPIAMRASIGGFPDDGFYCQLRYGPEGGKPEDLIAMLDRVLYALRKCAPHLSDGRGVEYKD